MALILQSLEGFEWDDGNFNKNWHLHRVTDLESEEVFLNMPLIVFRDPHRNADEDRFFALGRTDADRHLFVAFTIRRAAVRVVSARDMTRSEDRKYAEKAKRHTEF